MVREGSRHPFKEQKQRTRRLPVSLCQNQRATEKEWSCVKGQGDSSVSAEEVGGGVMLFLHGTPLVMTSMCVSG